MLNKVLKALNKPTSALAQQGGSSKPFSMDTFAACPDPGCAEAVGSSPLRSEYSEVEMRDSATPRSGVKNAQPVSVREKERAVQQKVSSH